MLHIFKGGLHLSKKKNLLLASGVATGLLATATSILGVVLSNKVMYMPKKNEDYVLAREKRAKRFDENWYNNNKAMEFTIPSPNGYDISAVYLKPLDTPNTVIICHGVTENKISSVGFARVFEAYGYNAIIYDHRRHGESGGKTTSYGFYEKDDLAAVVKRTKEIVGADAIIGIHGESMGAATTLLYAGSPQADVDFYVADCGFSDLQEMIKIGAKEQFNLESMLPIHLVDFFIRLRDGYNLQAVSPIKVVENITKPILFVHSIKDAYIPVKMSVDMYQKTTAPKMLKLFERGGHAQSYSKNPKLYKEVIGEFLTNYVPTIK